MHLPMSSRSREEIEQWIVDRLATALACEPTQIETTVPMIRYGVDSAQVVEIAAFLSDQLDYDVEPGLFWDFEDIRSLSHFLAEEIQR